jgi:hypothetical protein
MVVSQMTWAASPQATSVGSTDQVLPTWSRSYQIYKQPHAIWLSDDQGVGNNLGPVQQTLTMAEKSRRRPEFVVYTIPLRDLGQSSEGGFKTYTDYLADNRLVAASIQSFVKRTKIRPRVYLEPDSLAQAIDYRRKQQNSQESQAIYNLRTNALRQLVDLYRNSGALVYLDAAHGGWFNYSDDDIDAMATALKEAGIEHAHGLTTNVSNRQRLADGADKGEAAYLQRLLGRLPNAKGLDIIVDTGRNGLGGLEAPARTYRLMSDGRLLDNETSNGRVIGMWRKDSETGELWFHPYFGPAKPLSRLLNREKYTYDEKARVLSAPVWLDPIGPIRIGQPPTDKPDMAIFTRYRYIKPPDECDGSLSCPPGWSRQELSSKLQALQPPMPTANAAWTPAGKQEAAVRIAPSVKK